MAAMRQLAAEGCDPLVVRAFAGRVAAFKRGNFGAPGAETARKIRALKRLAEKAAKQAAELTCIRGFWSPLAQADCLRLPEEFEGIVERLSRVQAKGYADWYPQRNAIIDLLEHVHSCTGRYHYPEVSTLINAEIAWWALKREEPAPEIRHDVDSLKMIIQRWGTPREPRVISFTGPSSTTPPSIDLPWGT